MPAVFLVKKSMRMTQTAMAWQLQSRSEKKRYVYVNFVKSESFSLRQIYLKLLSIEMKVQCRC